MVSDRTKFGWVGGLTGLFTVHGAGMAARQLSEKIFFSKEHTTLPAEKSNPRLMLALNAICTIFYVYSFFQSKQFAEKMYDDIRSPHQKNTFLQSDTQEVPRSFREAIAQQRQNEQVSDTPQL